MKPASRPPQITTIASTRSRRESGPSPSAVAITVTVTNARPQPMSATLFCLRTSEMPNIAVMNTSAPRSDHPSAAKKLAVANTQSVNQSGRTAGMPLVPSAVRFTERIWSTPIRPSRKVSRPPTR